MDIKEQKILPGQSAKSARTRKKRCRGKGHNQASRHAKNSSDVTQKDGNNPHANQSSNQSSDRKQTHPRGLHGKEIGMYYANKKKMEKAEEETLKHQLADLPDLSPDHYQRLTNLIMNVSDQYNLSAMERDSRQQLLQHLKRAIHIPDKKLRLYGSFLTDFALHSCDLNIHIELANYHSIELEDIEDTLLNSGYRPTLKKSTMSIECVSVTSPVLELVCHISVGPGQAVYTSQFIHLYSNMSPCVRPLALAFRSWALICGMFDADTVRLPSYCLDMMVIYFLQRVNPPVLPILQLDPELNGAENIQKLTEVHECYPFFSRNMSGLGKLWVQMLHFYSALCSLEEVVVAIDKMEIVTQKQRDWHAPMAVEDPFFPNRNVIQGSHYPAVGYLKKCLLKSFCYFTNIHLPSTPTKNKSKPKSKKQIEQKGNIKKPSAQDQEEKSIKQDDSESCDVVKEAASSGVATDTSEGESLLKQNGSVQTTSPGTSSRHNHVNTVVDNDLDLDIRDGQLPRISQSCSELAHNGAVGLEIDDCQIPQTSQSHKKAVGVDIEGNNVSEIQKEIQPIQTDQEEIPSNGSVQNDSPDNTSSRHNHVNKLVDNDLDLDMCISDGQLPPTSPSCPELAHNSVGGMEIDDCQIHQTSQSHETAVRVEINNEGNNVSEIQQEDWPIKTDEEDMPSNELGIEETLQTNNHEQQCQNLITHPTNKTIQHAYQNGLEHSLEDGRMSYNDSEMPTRISDNHTVCDRIPCDKQTSDVKAISILNLNHINSPPTSCIRNNKAVAGASDKVETIPNFAFKAQFLADASGPPRQCSRCEKTGHTVATCPLKDFIVEPLPEMDPAFLDLLTSVIENIPKRFELTEADKCHREMRRKETETIVQNHYPGTSVVLFGSSLNGFGFHTSDVDMYANTPDRSMINLKKIAKELYCKPHLFSNVSHIKWAKIPLVKFDHRLSGLSCDLSIDNQIALTNTQLLYTYQKIDPRVKMLGYAIKVFAKTCDIGDAAQGTLSSYTYIILMIHYLQHTNPPILPVLQQLPHPKKVVEGHDVGFFRDLHLLAQVWPEYGKNTQSAGELWLGFFCYYLEHFDLDTQVVTIRQLDSLTKAEKGWQRNSMAVEDPFDLKRNLSNRSFKTDYYIRQVFARGRKLYGTPIKEPPTQLSAFSYFFNKEVLTKGLKK